jgi:hypothetical protein
VKLPTMFERVEPLFASEPMKIGKHEWILFVYEDKDATYWCDTKKEIARGVRRFTSYAWRGPTTPGKLTECSSRPYYRQSVDDWCPMEAWPTYDGNHCDSGMPRRLRALWEKNEASVRPILNRN